MNVTFYQTYEEKNKLNKQLGEGITLSGHLTTDVSIMDPVLIIALNTNITVCNYCYIPAFGRYYFITDITTVNKELVIKLHVDVLMSFKADILASKAVINRTNVGDNYITDNLILQTPKVIRQCQRIGSSFTKSEKYVVQIGG